MQQLLRRNFVLFSLANDYKSDFWGGEPQRFSSFARHDATAILPNRAHCDSSKTHTSIRWPENTIYRPNVFPFYVFCTILVGEQNHNCSRKTLPRLLQFSRLSPLSALDAVVATLARKPLLYLLQFHAISVVPLFSRNFLGYLFFNYSFIKSF